MDASLRSVIVSGQPLMPLRAAPYRRENSGGTVRDVVCFSVRLRPPVSLAPGAGSLRGPFTIALEHTGQFLRIAPGSRAVPPGGLAAGNGSKETGVDEVRPATVLRC